MRLYTEGAPGLGSSAKLRLQWSSKLGVFLPSQEWRGGPGAPAVDNQHPFVTVHILGELLDFYCSRSLFLPQLALLPAQEEVVISFSYDTRRTIEEYTRCPVLTPAPPPFGTKPTSGTTSSDCLGRHNIPSTRLPDPRVRLT